MPLRRCVVLLVCLAVTGCVGGTVNQQNFDRLKVGMSAQDVETVMGKGGKELSSDEIKTLVRDALTPKSGPGLKVDLPDMTGAKGLRWGSDTKSITVIYLGDRVARIFKKGF